MHEQLRKIKHLQNKENSTRDHRAETAKRSRHQKPITPTPQSESMHNLGLTTLVQCELPTGSSIRRNISSGSLELLHNQRESNRAGYSTSYLAQIQNHNDTLARRVVAPLGSNPCPEYT